MASIIKYCPLFFLFISAINCNGQVSIINGRTKLDTTIAFRYIDSIDNLICRLQERVELQNRELVVLNNLDKTDTAYYGKDSTTISFFSKNNNLLKTIKFRYSLSQKSKSKALTIKYFNAKGLLDYEERWDGYKRYDTILNTSGMTKELYLRNEYDDKNRLIREVIYYPGPPVTKDYILTYDAQGNATTTGKMIRFTTFWGSAKKTLKR